jgi:hypothetical protein
MREWLRARWRALALLGVVIGTAVLVALTRARDGMVRRRDARTDRKLNKAHEGHVSHEAKADVLAVEAQEVEAREKLLREQGQMDFGGMDADEVAAAFKRISEERGSK